MMSPRPAQHILRVATTPTGVRTYLVLCDGPDDSCRAYRECVCNFDNPAYDAELFSELMEWEWEGFYHGVEHRQIEGSTWWAPTDACLLWVHTNVAEIAGELVAEQCLPDGDHRVRHAWTDRDSDFFDLHLVDFAGQPL